jgi:4'-phosphopantetheinyl transferase
MTNAIWPVIHPVSPTLHIPNGREKVLHLSRLAREAVKRSAQLSRAPDPLFPKNSDGAPVPEAGWYWSLTHKPEVVAGIVAQAPVGIDVEKIRPVHANLHLKICDLTEWDLCAEPPLIRFFRYWTAKEAVLKALGLGLQGLSSCHIQTRPGPLRMELVADGNVWRVEHLFIADHLAAVAYRSGEICWTLGHKSGAI